MDLIVWTRIIAPTAIIIFIIYVVISANRLDKIITRRKAAERRLVKASVDSSSVDPTTIDSLEQSHLIAEITQAEKHLSKTDEIQNVSEKLDKELLKQTIPQKTSESIPPVPVDSVTKLPSKGTPVTSLLELSTQTFREGIILSEILGRPKVLRSRW